MTLRHLLTMTSGLVEQESHSFNRRAYMTPRRPRPRTARTKSARAGPWNAMPGTQWSYNNLHLQIAGAMAARAANLTVGAMLERHLIRKLGLSSTSWRHMHTNPLLAGGMVSSGADYEKILQAVLAYRGWSKQTLETMERDTYEAFPGLQPAPNAKDRSIECFGHYGMRLFLECPEQPWDEACRRMGVLGNPGAFGYWPVLNRRRRYYMQLVVHQDRHVSREMMRRLNLPNSVSAGALTAMCVSPLRFSLTAAVEAALGLPATDPWPRHLQLAPFPFNILCDLVASAEVADQDRALAAAEGRHGRRARTSSTRWREMRVRGSLTDSPRATSCICGRMSERCVRGDPNIGLRRSGSCVCSEW